MVVTFHVVKSELLGIRSGKYIIENVKTSRYLLQDGPPKGNRGAEGGWLPGIKAPLVVGADANYEGRAYWNIIPKSDGRFLIENVKTRRYLLQDGPRIEGKRGTVGAWLPCVKAPLVGGADSNYYGRAYWKFIPKGGGRFLIENVKTKRYLLQDGRPIEGERGAEGGWLPVVNTPVVVGADSNYYGRAYWKLRFQDSD